MLDQCGICMYLLKVDLWRDLSEWRHVSSYVYNTLTFENVLCIRDIYIILIIYYSYLENNTWSSFWCSQDLWPLAEGVGAFARSTSGRLFV